MNQTFTLFSLNTERSRHRDTIASFLDAHPHDILCFQELMEDDFHFFMDRYRYYGTYAPQINFLSTQLDNISYPRLQGTGILSKYPMAHTDTIHYIKNPLASDGVPERHHHTITNAVDKDGQAHHDRDTRKNSILRPLVRADVAFPGDEVTILTTHFTWTGAGSYDNASKKFSYYEEPLGIEEARRDLKPLMQELGKISSFILTGDFQAGRYTDVYKKLSENLSDHIPKTVTSTFDPDLFRFGQIPVVADYMLSTKDFISKDVRVQTGLSDHCAIMGTFGHK